jgi:hypothetical protein
MNKLFTALLILMPALVTAQTATVKTYAFSRTIIPGAPPNEPRPVFPKEYYIYIVLPAGTAPKIRGLWLDNKYHKATLQPVASPVAAPDNPAVNYGAPDTLVPATRQQVYQVIPGGVFKMPLATKGEKSIMQRQALVVFLIAGKKYLYGRLATIQKLPDLPMM